MLLASHMGFDCSQSLEPDNAKNNLSNYQPCLVSFFPEAEADKTEREVWDLQLCSHVVAAHLHDVEDRPSTGSNSLRCDACQEEKRTLLQRVTLCFLWLCGCLACAGCRDPKQSFTS